MINTGGRHPGNDVVTGLADRGGGNMARGLARGIDAIMAGGATGASNGAVIHGGGHRKTQRGMAHVTGSGGGDMGR